MKTIKTYKVFFYLMMMPASAFAASPGPHGGTLVHGGGQKMEVAIDSAQNKVHVYVLKRSKTFPGAIGISLLDSQGNKTLLELKTIDPEKNPLQYSTSLTGGNQSYVGFELKIPFKKEKPLVIESADLVKH